MKEGELKHSAQELELRWNEIKIEEGKQNLERRRMWFVGIGVQVTLALVSALPTAINNVQNNRFQADQIERELLIEEAKLQTERVQFEYSILQEALSPDLTTEQRAEALLFLIQAGVLQTVDRDRLEALVAEHLSSDGADGLVPSLPQQ